MFFIDVGSQKLYDQDTWEVDQFSYWSDDLITTWIDECNFRDSLYLEGSPDIGIGVYGRSTAEFAIWDEDAIWHYYQGQVVEIRDDNYELLFGGVVETVEEERIKGPVNHRVHHLACVDWNWIADKRLLFMSVENQHAGDIVTTIFNTILIDEGVIIGEIQEGALIPEFRAGYCTLTEALDSLAEYSEFIWFITEARELYFITPTTFDAPRALADNDILEDTYNYSIGNDQYRNRQYSIGGQGRTNQLTEEFAGDGKTRTFKLSRSVAIEPAITVNGSPKTVGIGQVDADGTHDWYWNEDSDSIIQDSTGTILSTSDTLRVVYIGLYKVINSASDYAQITARAALDSTSGIIEEVMTGSLMTSADAAVAAAEAKLSRYARDAKKFDFQTVSNEFAVGTMLAIEFTAFDFVNDYLITNIHITEDDDGGGPSYAITCCDGPASTEWEDVYKDINHEARSGKIEIGALNDSDLLVYKGFVKTWIEVDYPNPFNCGVVDDAEYASDPLIPGFDPQDRWMYVVVYNAGTEIFRKAVLAVEHLTDRDYASCYIAASEAVGTISHIGLWGGQGCSATPGSGIELDKQVYVRDKTNSESLQVVFTQIKGWS
jgi:hypothetical protein